MNDATLFSTPWFNVTARSGPDDGLPQYLINGPDFVIVLAKDLQGRLLLVRQHRVAMGGMTLELPAGQVDAGETPEQSARKELLEETGYEAPNFEMIARLAPSTARSTNRMWVFVVENAVQAKDAAERMEPGMNLVIYEKDWRALLDEPEFYGAASCAALFAALVRGRLV